MSKKLFYLVPWKDVVLNNKPGFCCRFGGNAGGLLPWRSAGETSRTRAELRVLKRLGDV